MAGKLGKAGKAGKTGPGQTKPRLGTTGKPAKQFRAEKHCENSKNGMNQVQVPPFELKLRQHGATPPRTPPEPLPPPKTHLTIKKV